MDKERKLNPSALSAKRERLAAAALKIYTATSCTRCFMVQAGKGADSVRRIADKERRTRDRTGARGRAWRPRARKSGKPAALAREQSGGRAAA